MRLWSDQWSEIPFVNTVPYRHFKGSHFLCCNNKLLGRKNRLVCNLMCFRGKGTYKSSCRPEHCFGMVDILWHATYHINCDIFPCMAAGQQRKTLLSLSFTLIILISLIGTPWMKTETAYNRLLGSPMHRVSSLGAVVIEPDVDMAPLDSTAGQWSEVPLWYLLPDRLV